MNTIPDIPLEQADKLGILNDHYVKAFMGGSRVICNPAPTDTDCDITVLVSSIKGFEENLPVTWNKPYTSEYSQDCDTVDGFATYRKFEYNLIVFENPEEFGAVRAATALAKHLNIQSKEKRYALFEKARSPWRTYN